MQEEGFEALMEETNIANTNGSHHSSKRSRAAEVHNLSEKVGFLFFLLIVENHYYKSTILQLRETGGVLCSGGEVELMRK